MSWGRRFAFAFAFGLWAAVAAAGSLTTLGAGGPPAAGAAYSGPGDVVSGAQLWYSCTRGYSAAYATGSNKACNLRRASDNATQDFNVLSNGNFDTAGANSFAGTDATCNASISGTTLTLQSGACSSALHVGDTLTGAGLTQPVYITAIGTCGSNTNGNTCTLNASQGTISTETITAQVALFATEAYDQSGANACSSAPCHVLQATGSAQPQWLPSCINSTPCLVFVSASSQRLLATGPTIAPPLSMSNVSWAPSSTSPGTVIGSNTANTTLTGYHFSGAANLASMSNGTTRIEAAATDGVFHTVQSVFNGTSSVLNVDGADTAPATNLPNSFSGSIVIGGLSGSFSNNMISEAGVWNFAATSGNRTSLCHNEYLYYGTAIC